MARKERTDYKTQEITYEELYCDECTRLVDDLYPVSFAGLEQEEWCETCIGERISRFDRARIKTEDLLEDIDTSMNGHALKILFVMYMIFTSSVGFTYGYFGVGVWEATMLMTVFAPGLGIAGIAGAVCIIALSLLLGALCLDILGGIMDVIS